MRGWPDSTVSGSGSRTAGAPAYGGTWVVSPIVRVVVGDGGSGLTGAGPHPATTAAISSTMLGRARAAPREAADKVAASLS
ncbi:hypothetical protein DL991_10370 [Amycolatopsis sp. WAC 01375]|nr:hypothetical protein DL991_10370 [Amycolatopsis sp. WAC 01375]